MLPNQQHSLVVVGGTVRYMFKLSQEKLHEHGTQL